MNLPVFDPPLGLAPMAGMTDTAFRRLVKRNGGCGLVVSEMVSSEGLVRGSGRTLEYAEFTEEERPVAIQIFGGDPARMAEAARVVERMGADFVDVNMGCPVPKISRSSAGCSLMREPERAAAIVSAIVGAVKIPVTVKMRAGWNDAEINAPELARMVEQAGAAAVAVHGRTAAQAYTGRSDWELIARVAEHVHIPVFGSGDMVEPAQIADCLRNSPVAGVLVGRGMLRNPWLFAQTSDLMAGRPGREVSREERGRFLLEYIDLLLSEGIGEVRGFRHLPPGQPPFGPTGPTSGSGASDRGFRRRAEADSALPDRTRWVIGKLRALAAWYTKGHDGGVLSSVSRSTTPTRSRRYAASSTSSSACARLSLTARGPGNRCFLDCQVLSSWSPTSP